MTMTRVLAVLTVWLACELIHAHVVAVDTSTDVCVLYLLTLLTTDAPLLAWVLN